MDLERAASPLNRWMLDPAIVHLNHGSFGACTCAAFDAAQLARRRLEASPMHWFVLEWQAEIDRAREKLAAFVRAPADRLAFVPSATTGVAIALQSMTLEAGDHVLATTHGYRAVRNQLRRMPITVNEVDIALPFDQDACVDAIANAITERTRLVVLDHITSPTAIRLPLERIVPRILAVRRMPIIIDGAHAPGQIDLDVGALLKLGVTWYAANNHKWLCAPKSTGFVVAAPDADVRPVVTSHGATNTYGPPNRMHAELDWSGTYDPSAHLAVPVAIDAFDWPATYARNHALAIEMRRRLAEALGASTTLAPEDALGAMAAVPITINSPPLVVERQLLTSGFEVPIVDWRGGPLVRVSAHLYNHAGEVDALASKLLALGIRGR